MLKFKFLLLFLFTCFKNCYGDNATCSPAMFSCLSGVGCINYSQTCNQIIDCSDGSDEHNCGPTCPDGWFHCHNGNCMLMKWKCDGENDCGDGSDELNCGRISEKCSHEEFRCHDNKRCILLSWVCDGHNDCQDGSDETPGCVREAPCEGFLCGNKKDCLPSRWRCDGQADCKDASDEFNCTGPENVLCTETNLKFYCKDRSRCLDHNLVCNGVHNCDDGSDEGGQCSENSCKKVECSHNCFQTPYKAICYCPKGYYMPVNSSKCQDVDECLNVTAPVCSHDCHNTVGSYVCSCLPGYQLKVEQTGSVDHECRAQPPEPILVYSASLELKVVKLHSGLVHTLHEGLNHAVGVDYDSIDEQIYWTEIAEGSETIKSCDIEGNDVSVIVNTGISVVEDIAIDWIEHNLYFTDSGFMRLAVCNKGGYFCKVLFSELKQPRALIIEPRYGLMYWSDWSHTPLIESSEMDGSSRAVVVSTGLGWPNGLAIDHALQRLYWIDAKLGRVEYVTLDARHERHFVFEQMMLHPFAFAVFEDTFYWTDWSRHTLESCNKFTGEDHKILIQEEGDNTPMGVHVYHPLTQSVFDNPCWDNDCQQMCLLKSNGKHVCACAENYNMGSDLKSCSATDIKKVYLSVEDTIYEYVEVKLGRRGLQSITKAKMVIGAIVYNPINDSILYSDVGSKEIVALDLETGQQSVLVSSHLQAVEGLAIDWKVGNLYWSDVERKTIDVMRLDGGHRTVLVQDGLDHPMEIALVPHKGFMFVSISSSRPRIEKMDMDGSDRHIFIDFEVYAPMSMAVDYEKELLYWTDVGEGKIEWTTFDGKKRFSLDGYFGRPGSIAIGHNLVMWTDVSDGFKVWMLKEPGSTLSNVDLELQSIHAKMTSITNLLLPNSSYPSGIDVCVHNNGGCSHLCLPNQKSYICACPMGMFLDGGDKHTCKIKIDCSSEDFSCSNGQCIPLSMTCDGFRDCSDGGDEVNCKPTCSLDEFQCGDHQCIPKRWVCDRNSQCKDGSDELDCKTSTCLPTSFQCHIDGACVPESWKCDGHADCKDGSDEKDCPKPSCHDGYFKCTNSHCIPISWKCDGEFDCRDSSDEIGCPPVKHQCRPIEFTCANDRCIAKELVCDKDDDCGDGSDEKPCEDELLCPIGMYKCSKSNKCIMAKSLCDGVNDCLNGEDEENCTRDDKQCRSNQFSCEIDGRCIPHEWTCDGDSDCVDGSDEMLVACHSSLKQLPEPPYMPVFGDFQFRELEKVSNRSTTGRSKSCPRMEYRCESGECISIHDVCNHKNDCKDHSDEGSFCSSACEENHGGCSDLCVPSPSGPICICRNGYRLETDAKTCFDIDECMYLGTCSQRCHNIDGTFVCSCVPGYVLRANHRSCKAEGPAPELLLAFSTKLLSYQLGSNHVKMIYHNGDSVIEDVDFDWKTNEIYWTDSSKGTIRKFSTTHNTDTILIGSLKSPKALAIDWISRLMLYWEKDGNGHLVVCTLDGRNCADAIAVESKIVKNIVVDPRFGYVYWSTWGSTVDSSDGTIERSSMKGKKRSTLAATKLVWPVGLNVDYLHDQLYWADARLQCVETMDLSGGNRRIVSRSSVNYPMSLTIFEDLLYWADWGTNSIRHCDKFSCADEGTVLLEPVIKVHDLAVYHPVQQPNGSSQCTEFGSSNCSHICVPTVTGYACLCPNGMVFNDHLNTTCVQDGSSLRKGIGGCRDIRFCFNGGRCQMKDGEEICQCIGPFSGKRCETKARISALSTPETPIAITSNDSHGMMAGVVVGILFVFAAALAAIFYFRRFGPRKFHNPFAHVPLRNTLFGDQGEPLDETDDDSRYNSSAEDTFKSYSNPMYNDTRLEMDINRSGEKSRVKFHVVESSGSLDSNLTSESGTTLIDYSDRHSS